jgi:sarcosine oxidase
MQRIAARNVIVGAGAMGSAAAYQLARRGEPVLLLEQFNFGHDRGSSHGAARITRHSYADLAYARLMPAAFQAWRELEAEGGEPLYFRSGGVSFSPPSCDYVARVAANLESIQVPHRRMTGAAWNRAHPVFSIPDAYDVVFEPDAGLLAADRAAACMRRLAMAHGGERAQLIAETPVRRIDLTAKNPVLITDSSWITADRLIVTAGAWVNRLLSTLPLSLEVTLQQVLYFRPAEPDAFRIGRFPVFIFNGSAVEEAFYGMPQFQHTGVKVARHFGPVVDPENEDRKLDSGYPEIVRGFLRGHVPGLADAPIDRIETCLYTMAPGERFFVDFLPGHSDIIVASPCSGHGFKFSCLIGKLLADMATLGSSHERAATDPFSAWRLPQPS